MGRWLEVDEGGGRVDDDGEMTMENKREDSNLYW